MTNTKYPAEPYQGANENLDNEWLCPYCLALTAPADTVCDQCRKPLLLERPVRSKRSVWLWRGIFLQIALIMMLVAAGAGLFTMQLKFNGIPSPVPYLPAYIGQSVDLPDVERALELFPPWLFWGFVGGFIYSVLLIGILYFRVRHGNTIYLVSASLLLAIGLVMLVFMHDTLSMTMFGMSVFVVGSGQLMITMNLWNDFKYRSGRLRLKPDSGAKSHITLYLSGRRYAELGIWGLAALHYRRAVGREPRRPIYHIALALAYYNLKQYDQAEKALSQAEKLDPNVPTIWELRKKLAQKNTAPSA